MVSTRHTSPFPWMCGAASVQLTYSTARLGLFRVFSDRLKEMSKGSDPTAPPPPLPLWKKAAAGLAAGGIAAAFGNPADLSLIRMQVGSQ